MARYRAAQRLLHCSLEKERALRTITRDLDHESFEVRLAAAMALTHPPFGCGAGMDPDVDRRGTAVFIEAIGRENALEPEWGAALV